MTPKTFEESLAQWPSSLENLIDAIELRDVEPKSILKLHLAQVVAARNENRRQIHSGELGDLDLKSAFHRLHHSYVGDNPLSFLVAHYVWSGNSPLSRLKWMFMDSGTKDYLTLGNYLEFRGGSKSQGLRTQGVGSDRTGLFPSPEHLPRLQESFFKKVEEFVQNKERYSVDQRYQFSIFAARILIRLHLKIDMNGRTIEDWMVELQRRLLSLETITPENQHNIKTWGRSGIISEQSELSDWDHLDNVLTDRGKELKNQYDEADRTRRHSTGRSGFNSTISFDLNEILVSSSEMNTDATSAIDHYYSDLIEKLDDPSVWTKFSIPQLTNDLIAFCDRNPYSYTEVSPNEIIELSSSETDTIREVLERYRELLTSNQQMFDSKELAKIKEDLEEYLKRDREKRQNRTLEISAQRIIQEQEGFNSQLDFILFIQAFVNDLSDEIQGSNRTSLLELCALLYSYIGKINLSIIDHPDRESSFRRRALFQEIQDNPNTQEADITNFLSLVSDFFKSEYFLSLVLEKIVPSLSQVNDRDNSGDIVKIISKLIQLKGSIYVKTVVSTFVSNKPTILESLQQRINELINTAQADASGELNIIEIQRQVDNYFATEVAN